MNPSETQPNISRAVALQSWRHSVMHLSSMALQGPQDRLLSHIKDDKKKRTNINKTSLTYDSEALNAVNNINLNDTVCAAFRGSDMKVIELIDNINSSSKEKITESFGQWWFAFGVANLLLTVIIFGKFPEYFWILYLIEALLFFPARFYNDWRTKPLSLIFNELEYCWVVNFLLFIIFSISCISIAGAGSAWVHPRVNGALAQMIFGTACGPLLAATVALPIPLLFHSVDIMSSFFIHFFPPVLVYTLRWQYEDLVERWPFWEIPLEFEKMTFWPIRSFSNSVFGVMVYQYFTWFVLYSIWQLSIGIDLPRKYRKNNAPAVYDTSFHGNMRKGFCMLYGTFIWKRSEAESQRMIDENDFELRDFAIYMIQHFAGVMASLIGLAWPCYHSQFFHGALLTAALLVVIFKGAVFYNNVMTMVYADFVRESVEAEIKKLAKDKTDDVEEVRARRVELDEIDENALVVEGC